MLLVADLAEFKMMQKTWKITETLANGYSSERALCESYPMNTRMTGFRWFLKSCLKSVHVLWTKIRLSIGSVEHKVTKHLKESWGSCIDQHLSFRCFTQKSSGSVHGNINKVMRKSWLVKHEFNIMCHSLSIPFFHHTRTEGCRPQKTLPESPCNRPHY